jgi:hypothetical protein
VRRARPNGTWLYGIMGRVDWGTQDGVCTVADEALPVLPRRRPLGELPVGEGAEPPRALPDLDVLRQVLAGLRRLD